MKFGVWILGIGGYFSIFTGFDVIFWLVKLKIRTQLKGKLDECGPNRRRILSCRIEKHLILPCLARLTKWRGLGQAHMACIGLGWIQAHVSKTRPDLDILNTDLPEEKEEEESPWIREGNMGTCKSICNLLHWCVLWPSCLLRTTFSSTSDSICHMT